METDPPRPPEKSREPHAVDYGELPELTRALRALGSARRSATLQTHFFSPLLSARRRAAAARNAGGRLAAFDCAELTRALERTVDRVVAEWPDTRPSARRAIRARLVDLLQPYVAAISLLAERAAVVSAAEERTRLAAWRGWTVQLAATFVAADRTWLALEPILLRAKRS